MVDGIILIRARCEFQRAAERLADSNESLTRARKGNYMNALAKPHLGLNSAAATQ